MLFELLCNTVYDVITTLLGWLDIPKLQAIDDVETVVTMAVENGMGFFKLFIDVDVVAFGLAAVIVLNAAKYIWSLVMWILKKIPMLGVS